MTASPKTMFGTLTEFRMEAKQQLLVLGPRKGKGHLLAKLKFYGRNDPFGMVKGEQRERCLMMKCRNSREMSFVYENIRIDHDMRNPILR